MHGRRGQLEASLREHGHRARVAEARRVRAPVRLWLDGVTLGPRRPLRSHSLDGVAQQPRGEALLAEAGFDEEAGHTPHLPHVRAGETWRTFEAREGGP